MKIDQLCISFDFLGIWYGEGVQQVIKNDSDEEKEQEKEKGVSEAFSVDLWRF